MGWFCISAVFWITGAILQGEWQILLWIIAAICDYTAPMHGFALPRLGRSDSSKEWTIEGASFGGTLPVVCDYCFWRNSIDDRSFFE